MATETSTKLTILGYFTQTTNPALVFLSHASPREDKHRCSCNESGHMAYQCPTGRNRPPVQRKPTQQQHGPLSGNEGVCIDLDHLEYSYHDGKAFLACGCGLTVVGSTGLDTHTNLPLLSGKLDGATVQVLRDTGCNGVIVRTCLVNPKQMTGQTKVLVRIDNTSIVAPVARCVICTPV